MSATVQEAADPSASPRDARAEAIVAGLQGRALVLIGMMGSGKTSVGKRLAARLGLPFHDADAEIEAAAQLTIAEIFAKHGEPHFRDGERKVMSRLLQLGPQVLATGGGAFMNEATRGAIAARGLSVWLRADFDVLMKRVRKRATRPLLQTPDPEGTLRNLIAQRYPTYELADICVVSQDGPHEAVVEAALRAIEAYLADPKRPLAIEEPLTPVTSAVSLAQSVERVEVGLGDRAYDILIGAGLIARAGAEIARRRPGAACAIVTDENLARLHAPALEASLEAAGVRHVRITLPAGEATKSFANFERVCDEILAAKMERGDLVVALGGGVMGDLAGFAASAVRRGMGFVQIPTTLLSQVDSSVGGKTGVNSRHGKNLIGAFYQPALVLADTQVLETLSPREFRAGYAEVAKYGLIDDRAFFEWLEANWRGVFVGGPARAQAIATSCRAKAAVVARDEFETGDRALLNLGHTFGHALERLTHYDSARLVHGEGVAIGMALAFRFSVVRGLCDAREAERVRAHLAAVELPTRIQDIAGFDVGADAIVEAMYQDKKVQRGALTFILARGIGESFVAKGVAGEDVRAFLHHELTGR